MKDPFEFEAAPVASSAEATAFPSSPEVPEGDGIEALFQRLAAISDRQSAIEALGDADFVVRLLRSRFREQKLRIVLNQYAWPKSVWQGLALLFPLTAELLLLLDPSRHDDIEAPVEDFTRALEVALDTHRFLLERLGHFYQADLTALEPLRAKAETLRRRIQETGAERAGALQQLQRLQKEVVALDEELAGAEQALQQAEAERQRQASVLQGLQEQNEAVAARLAETVQEMAKLEKAVAQEQCRYQEESQRLAREARHLDELKAALKAYGGMGQARRLLDEIDKIRQRVQQLKVPDRLDEFQS